MIPNPWLILGGVLMLIAAYATGRVEQHRIEQGSQLKAERAADKQREHDQALIQDSGIAAALRENARQASVREITRETQTVVDRPVYSTVCVDADGVRLLDDAVTVANGGDRGPAAGGPAAVSEGSANH